MQIINFPKEIERYIRNKELKQETIGCSGSSVFSFTYKDKTLYLKMQKTNEEFTHEQDIVRWLESRLPVPKIIVQCQENGYDYLLMTKVRGEMSCSSEYLKNPEELVRLLADGIKILQEVEISDCKFECTIDNKLRRAKKLVDNKEVCMVDWEERTPFNSPEELYEYLALNKPKEELVFSHGDYCLPNIFLEGGEITGFIDLGRAGIADKWQDIALAIRSIEFNLKSDKYADLFFRCLGIEPDYEKIKYYILLDELF